jgi:hypothetical protein
MLEMPVILDTLICAGIETGGGYATPLMVERLVIMPPIPPPVVKESSTAFEISPAVAF